MRRLAVAVILAATLLLSGCGEWSHYHFTPDNAYPGGDPANFQCGIVTHERGDWLNSTVQPVGRVCKVPEAPK